MDPHGGWGARVGVFVRNGGGSFLLKSHWMSQIGSSVKIRGKLSFLDHLVLLTGASKAPG